MTKEYSSESGTALAEAPTPVVYLGSTPAVALDAEFAYLACACVISSLTNPRKNFNAVKLQELADSIKDSGVHQPILVRPLPSSRLLDTSHMVPRPTHELVCGERRWRGCNIAKALMIPAMIRALTDAQVLEIQIIENLQRDDLTELEEAEGYASLMAHSSITADQVGAKIGKSRSYVYGRLKLLDLSIECKDAMRAGQIDASRALLIARIPDTKLQTKALQEATRSTNHLGDVPSVRALQSWMQTNVMLRLDKATFKITDARLLKDAGSCKVCPKRTGANPDLFADVSSADICTDPACFHAKEVAHVAALRTMAEKKGMRVIEGAEALTLLASEYGSEVDGYSPLAQVRNDITVDGKCGLTMRELLGKDAPDPVLFEHPRTKELMELVPTDEAEGVLLAKGLLHAAQPIVQAAINLDNRLANLQRSVANATARAVRNAICDETKRVILATDDKTAKALLSSNFIRAWLHTELDDGYYTVDDVAEALGYVFQENEDEMDALTIHINASSHAALCRAMVIMLVGADDFQHYTDSAEPLMLNCLTSELAIDTKKLVKDATKAVKGQYSDEIKDTKAQIDAKKAPTTIAPLAQPKPADGQGQPTGSKTPVRKAKLSAEDAKSGIAAAMQSQDRAATAPPELPASEAGAGLVAGAKVRVLADKTMLPGMVARHAGKEGSIYKDLGDNYYTVKLQRGGSVTFGAGQLELVEGVAA